MKKEIFLFRHGDVEDKFKKRFRGALDVNLSPLGEQMSHANAKFLLQKPVDLVITSGLKRTDFVGKIVAPQGLRHEVDPRFAEARFGQWEGKSWDEVTSLFPEAAKTYKQDFLNMQFPGGESVAQLQARLLAAWTEVLKRPESRIAIIGHSTGNGCLMSFLKKITFAQVGMQIIGSYHEIHSEPHGLSIVAENIVLY